MIDRSRNTLRTLVPLLSIMLLAIARAMPARRTHRRPEGVTEMRRSTLKSAAIAAAAMLALSACSSTPQSTAPEESTVPPTWQETAKASADAYQASLTDAQLQEQCAAITTFGLDSAEEAVAFAESLGSPDLSEYGIDPASVPQGSEHEAALIGAQAVIEACA